MPSWPEQTYPEVYFVTPLRESQASQNWLSHQGWEKGITVSSPYGHVEEGEKQKAEHCNKSEKEAILYKQE